MLIGSKSGSLSFTSSPGGPIESDVFCTVWKVSGRAIGAELSESPDRLVMMISLPVLPM